MIKSFTTIVSLSTVTFLVEAQEKTFYSHSVQKEWNYAQAYRSGNLLYISGIPASGQMDKAIDAVYKRLETTLRAYDLDFSHVIKENLYATAIDSVIQHLDHRKKYYGDHTPAATWVQVSRLADPNCILEVELIAEIKKTP
ncbi:RidA family protein [Olivibacter sitiensis]|uniref:RidA family protein n=1 Tax=Olivibacter sitiensis TaxID=376470 RepID=UPI00040D1CC1|nr:RidA family protein [Olivibacter sitiensis]